MQGPSGLHSLSAQADPECSNLTPAEITRGCVCSHSQLAVPMKEPSSLSGASQSISKSVAESGPEDEVA